jgi:NAD(P)-dependent dehydrogenase (short-subunit alcohol dehydrogenase family)
LARRGSRVYLACRNKERGLAAIENIKKDLKRINADTESPDIRFLQLDLNRLKQVETAAAELLTAEPHIHILVNNAGIMSAPFNLTEDGIESHFGVNHVGPTLFTQRLFDTIKNSGTTSDPSRIVFTSSALHERAGPIVDHLDLDTINDKDTYGFLKAYGLSKLSNILTAKHFAQQATEDGQPTVLVNVVHPGMVRTDLGDNFMRFTVGSDGYYSSFPCYLECPCKMVPSQHSTQQHPMKSKKRAITANILFLTES